MQQKKHLEISKLMELICMKILKLVSGRLDDGIAETVSLYSRVVKKKQPETAKQFQQIYEWGGWIEQDAVDRYC